MKALNKIFSALAFSSVIALSATVHAQDEEAAAAPPPPDPREEAAKTLNELLEFVKQGQVTEASENRAREQRFVAAKADQQRMLNEAEAEREREEQRSSRLENQFNENEILIAEKQE
ncbi:MAG: energy transducer TonB, partial [Halieaceae bacterium]|nr:energy transducer TonB [Halieaceae bacterium]